MRKGKPFWNILHTKQNSILHCSGRACPCGIYWKNICSSFSKHDCLPMFGKCISGHTTRVPTASKHSTGQAVRVGFELATNWNQFYVFATRLRQSIHCTNSNLITWPCLTWVIPARGPSPSSTCIYALSGNWVPVKVTVWLVDLGPGSCQPWAKARRRRSPSSCSSSAYGNYSTPVCTNIIRLWYIASILDCSVHCPWACRVPGQTSWVRDTVAFRQPIMIQVQLEVHR